MSAGSARRLFWLYRPSAPTVRAQAIQVVHAAHAAARRGHHVTLCVQATAPGITAEEVLAFHGLAPHPGLDLRVLPRSNTVASCAFRAVFARWARRGGVAVARSKRYAVQAARWAPRAVRVVLEAHEVDSLLAAERGEDPAPWRALEARALAGAAGVVCNCEGTLELLRRAHPDLPPAVALHNATHADRFRAPRGTGRGVGYVGSLRAAKDPGLLADLARHLGEPVVVVGPDRDPALEARSGGWLRFEPPRPPAQVADRMARFAVLVLPVGTGLFGARLTSPLKLWDYLASGRPVVAADTPAIRAAAGDAVRYARPGDPADFARAVRSARAEPEALRRRARARARTWDQRAAELDRFLDRIAPVERRG